jgi:hypothetical protein
MGSGVNINWNNSWENYKMRKSDVRGGKRMIKIKHKIKKSHATT